MPLTAQVLKGEVETREQYAVRRVQRATADYIKEGIRPSRWQIILRASAYLLMKNPMVKQSLDDAMNMLESEWTTRQPMNTIAAAS
jgi:hypothetical protein